mmetsp:Transcript_10808/g.13518  ORF Transcript_10808/g.13518 Transcript_10808/m.13518 type:complete len:387 (+) Transcript_10808:3-1163(+)
MGLRDSPKKLHEEMVKSGRLGKREARRAHRLFSSGLPLKMLEEQYEKKIAWSASTLKSVDAQVWGFQELCHPQALRDVFEKADLNNKYEILVREREKGEIWDEDVSCAAAVLKGSLVGKPKWFKDIPQSISFDLKRGEIIESSVSEDVDQSEDEEATTVSVDIKEFQRSVLYFQVKPFKPHSRTGEFRGKPISVFVAHLKSKRPSRVRKPYWNMDEENALGLAMSTIKRTAEAAALRFLLIKEMKGNDTPVILLGDLNDDPHSNTLDIISGAPRYLDSRGHDTALYSTNFLEQYRSLRDIYYTYVHQNKHETLDHILVSEEFYENSKRCRWKFRGLYLKNDHLDKDKATKEHEADGTSDHAIVKAKFEYNCFERNHNDKNNPGPNR